MVEFLNSVAPAPPTPEAETIRAAIGKRLPAQNDYCWWECHGYLMEASLIDEQHLLAKLKALHFGKFAECSDESLIAVIAERAAAYIRYCLAEQKRWRAEPDPESDKQDQTLIESLEASVPGDRLAKYTRDQQTQILWKAIHLTEAEVQRSQRAVWASGKALNACYPDDNHEDPVDVPPVPEQDLPGDRSV
jgi:hypothetical protein